jgi:hypothetical protein
MTARTDRKAQMPKTLVETLKALSVRGILMQMAQRGQIVELRCEMPKCYCPKGRKHFDKKSSSMTDWAPNADHYPRLKADGGHLETANVRLAHVLCNRMDYGWRIRIRNMLKKEMPLAQIAEVLNRTKGPKPHGTASWTAANVRRAFVS